MKGKKLLILAAFASLTLAGCGGNANNAQLPAGGKNIDLKTDEGVATLKARVNGLADNYTKFEFKALGLQSETKNVSFGVNGKLNTNFGNFEGKVGLNNVGASLNLAIGSEAGEAEGQTTLAGALTLGGVTGNFTIDGTYQQPSSEDKIPVNRSLDFTGAKAAAYIHKGNIYLDGSDQGVLDLLDRTAGFANNVIGDLDLSPLALAALAKGLGFDFSKILSKDFKSFDFKTPYVELLNSGKVYISQPILSYINFDAVSAILSSFFDSLQQKDEETQQSQLDQFVTGLLTINDLFPGLTVKEYGEKGIGLQIDVNKESLKTLAVKVAPEDYTQEQIDEIKARVDKYFTSCDFTASVYVNDKALLESVAVYCNVEANVQLGKDELQDSPISLVDLKVNAHAEEKLTVLYNDDVKLEIPSEEYLATFKEYVPANGEAEEK